MSTIYDALWSGHVVPKSDYGGNNITTVQSQWNVPSVSAGTTSSFKYAGGLGVWTGIGMTDLLQAGSVSVQTSGSATYKMFDEDYPQSPVYEGPTIHPGNLIFVQVIYEGANQTLYYMENETSGVADEFNHSTPYVGSADADYILENRNLVGVPKFTDFLVSDNYFWQGSTRHELTTTNNRWEITSNCTSTGTLGAAPTSVSYGQFYQDFYHTISPTC